MLPSCLLSVCCSEKEYKYGSSPPSPPKYGYGPAPYGAPKDPYGYAPKCVCSTTPLLLLLGCRLQICHAHMLD